MTPRQMEVLRFLGESHALQGFSPTLQEIADGLGINKVTVFGHIAKLREGAFMWPARNKYRALHLTKKGKLAIQRQRPSVEYLERWIGPLSKGQKARLAQS